MTAIVHPIDFEGRGIFLAKEADPHITELAMLLMGKKPVLYTHFDTKDSAYLEGLCRHFGLVSLLPGKIPATTTATRKAMLIGRDRTVLRRAEKAFNSSALSADWGIALGYPECCVKFYIDFKHASSLGGEAELIRGIASAPAAAPYSFMLNNVLNMFSRFPATSVGVDDGKYRAMHERNAPLDLRALHVVPWHPCSYACAESLARGREIFAFLSRHVPSLAAKTKVSLRRHVLFVGQYEFIFFDGRRDGNELICDRVAAPFSLLKGPPWDSLRPGARISTKGATSCVQTVEGDVIELPSSPPPVLLDFTADR